MNAENTLSNPEDWKFVDDYDITRYQCGLTAGDQVRVVNEIICLNSDGNPTGQVHRVGEVWGVLKGSTSDPGVVWLREPNGDPHTWDDDPSIFNTFEKC